MKRIKNLLGYAIIVFLIFSLTKNITQYQQTVQLYEGYKLEYEQVQKRHIQLKTEIIKSRDQYEQEKIMRNELGLQKPGETTIIVPRPTAIPPTPTPTPEVFYMRWYKQFLKR